MEKFLNPKSIFKSLTSFAEVKISGPDACDFLQRQLTSDVDKLETGKFQLSSRLDRAGRIHSFFYLSNLGDSYSLFMENDLQQTVFDELNKFLIMEDVELTLGTEAHLMYFGLALLKEENKKEKQAFGNFVNLPAVISKAEITSELVTEEEMRSLHLITAWPSLEYTIDLNTLINDCRLNELAVSYQKGCFLGQETIAKIETRRGAAKYPCWVSSSLEFENDFELEGDKYTGSQSVKYHHKFYKLISLPRKHRINGKEYNELTVYTISPFAGLDHLVFAENLYHDAITIFHQGSSRVALEMIESVIILNPYFADAYEVKGAILGQQDKFQEAIDVMDNLLEVDADSVMAHTNKSLYLMKLGKIEEAEEEKSLATVASFKKFGDEAKFKKELEAKKQQELADLERREGMFHQVLEIDPEDDIANFGLADIFFKREDFDNALEKVEVVLKIKPKYSQAYLLKGKILEAFKEYRPAIDIYLKGIEVASAQGELMPANEMQARVNSIKNIL